MISEEAFPVEPWMVRETRLDLNVIAQSESLFALANGHIGLRGNLDEGEPHGLPGTYLNSFYEIRPLPYAEAGYGYPEAGQTIVDVTNGKIIRLFVEDEPFDVRYGELLSHERVLDLRAGTLTRRAHWRSPAGKQVKLVSTRLVSLANRGVAAIEYVVEASRQFPSFVAIPFPTDHRPRCVPRYRKCWGTRRRRSYNRPDSWTDWQVYRSGAG